MNFKSKFLLEEHLVLGHILLENTCKGLTESQSKIVKGIYHEFLPLIEASLTADQISQLFKNVEQQATASGSNRTALGKAVDIPSQVNDVINKVGQWLQNTAPVQFADQKFEDLKAKVAAKFPNLDQQLTNFGTWMKENPGKSAAVIGVLTALASLAGGPVGGAIAGQVLRGAAELIKGEKLSTAVGKGVKTAALGYLSGKAFEMLGDWIGGFREQAMPFGPEDAGLEKVSYQATRTIRAPGMEWTRNVQGFDVLVRPEEAEVIRNAMAGVKAGDASAFETLATVGREIHSKDYMKSLDGIVQGAWQAAKDNDSILQFINATKQGLQAASQGAVAASTGSAPAAQPTVEQVQELFQKIHDYYVDEGILDTIKGAAGKAVDWAKTKGANITNKVTADKLQQAWQAAGSPTDSEEVKKILQSAGVDTTIIDQTFSSIGIQPSTNTQSKSQSATKSSQALTVKVADINKLIPTLKIKELKSLQQVIDSTLSKRKVQPT